MLRIYTRETHPGFSTMIYMNCPPTTKKKKRFRQITQPKGNISLKVHSQVYRLIFYYCRNWTKFICMLHTAVKQVELQADSPVLLVFWFVLSGLFEQAEAPGCGAAPGLHGSQGTVRQEGLQLELPPLAILGLQGGWVYAMKACIPEGPPITALFKINFPLGFPGGAVVENLPASAGDTGSIPGPGRSHMPRSN